MDLAQDGFIRVGPVGLFNRVQNEQIATCIYDLRWHACVALNIHLVNFSDKSDLREAKKSRSDHVVAFFSFVTIIEQR